MIKYIASLIFIFSFIGFSVPPEVSANDTPSVGAVVTEADNDYFGDPSWDSAVQAETETDGIYRVTNETDGYSFLWNPSSGEITAVENARESMVVPGKIDGVEVKKLGNGLFRKNGAVKYIVVSEGIQTIDWNALRESSSLIGVKLPSTLTEMMGNQFLSSYNLKEVNLQNTHITEVAGASFKGCSSLESIELPETVKSIGGEAFSGCTYLTDITFDGNVERMNSYDSFYGTPSLRKVTFNGGTAPADVSAFAYAGGDYRVKVYYPKSGTGYDEERLRSAFRQGTEFIALPEEEAPPTGKPGSGSSIYIITDVSGPVKDGMFFCENGIGDYAASAKVYNYSNEEKTIDLISAWYDTKSDILVRAAVDEFTVPPAAEDGNCSELEYTGTFVKPDSLEDLTMRIYAWDVKTMTPYTEPLHISGIYSGLREVESSTPGGMYTAEQIAFVRDKIAKNEEPWKSAYEQLVTNADAWINEEPSPASHWYVPGYYGNASGHEQARSSMVDDLKSAYSCALLYQLSGKTIYADQAVRILNAWAKTMVSYGSEDSVLVFNYVGNGFIQTAELIKDYSGWNSRDKGEFDWWVNDIYIPIANKAGGAGNSRDWGLFARVLGNIYLGKTDAVAQDIEYLKYLLSYQIDPETHTMPEENLRGGNGMWYTYFALAPLSGACQAIYNTTGEDYFNTPVITGDGQYVTVAEALEKYFYYCNHVSEWPYNNGNPVSYPSSPNGYDWPLQLWEAMVGTLGNTEYTDYAAEQRPVSGPINDGVYHHFAYFYPTLMYGACTIK